MRAVALRYALAPACVLLAVLVHLSPAGSLFPPAGLFVFAVLGAAWFGGPGPGVLSAALGALAMPQLMAVSHPVLGGFLDLPRLIAFSVIGLAVGWGSSLRAGKLREQERYARAMEASGDGFWDWIPATDTIHVSPRLLEIYGFAPGTMFNGRDDFVRRIPFHPEDRLQMARAVAEHFAGKRARLDIQMRFTRDAETRWAHLSAVALRDAAGAVARWTGTVREITEHKRVEEALRESEDRFARAVAGSYDGVWDVDFVARKVFFSARTRELCGLPPGPEVVPLEGCFESMPLHPEDRPKRDAAVEAHLSGKAPVYEGEFRFLQPDGVYRWRHLHGVCVRDARGKPLRVAGSISDVDGRRRTEDALRESEQGYELAMDASESGYWDWHIPTNRYFASPRAIELAGFPPGTAWVTRDQYRANINMHPEDFARWEAAREALFAGMGERLSMEVRYIVRGESRWHLLHAICRRDATGKVVRWGGSATDITARKLAEEALRESERKLRQAQRLESMGTFAGGIAHDFNNILGAILGFGEMARRGARKDTPLARDLDSILVAGERGRALVGRLLAFSRSVVGERVPVHVERVAREVLDQVSAKLPPSVTLHPKLHAGRSAILGDATQVHQVVTNLTTNAIHAMPDGGTLRVQLSTVRVEAPRAATIGELAAGEYVVLTVADTGIGIAPEVMERMFDPFFTTKEVGTGTGLGLSLVHGIVTELGGGVDVASKLGAGTTFTVYLPRSGEAPEAQGDPELELPRGEGQRVLVVDDEEPLVRLATRTLEELGYAPLGFTSSSAALAALRADPQRFDALIADERMPGMSGSALIREVRDIRSSMPVVLVSGYLGPTADKVDESGRFHTLGLSQKIAAALGADEVLQKPLSTRDLARSLARVLRP
jgi:PAS domain S-box-containing protein